MRFLLVLVGLFLAGDSRKLPKTWGRCSKSSPEFSACLQKNIEFAVRSLSKPTPELKLASFDPLDIPELTIGEGKGAVNVIQNFKNVKLHGLTDVEIFKASIDFDKKTMYAESNNANLRLQADYTMKGHVLLLPIVGDGPCNVTLINMKIKHHLNFEYVEKTGKTYIKVVDFRVTMDPEKVIFKFDNLFNGENPELSNNINKVLNDNNLDIFNDVKPGYEKSFGLIFKDLANQVFLRVPEKDIYLD